MPTDARVYVSFPDLCKSIAAISPHRQVDVRDILRTFSVLALEVIAAGGEVRVANAFTIRGEYAPPTNRGVRPGTGAPLTLCPANMKVRLLPSSSAKRFLKQAAEDFV